MRVIVELTPRPIAAGLGMDEALLGSAVQGRGSVRFWVSDLAVVVGRSQSVRDEVDEDLAEEWGAAVARRMSGGGAVLHYPGNLNVSVAVPVRGQAASVSETFAFYGEVLCRGLRAVGVSAHRSGTALLVGEAKIAGAAQARRAGGLLYHSTVLVEPWGRSIASILRAHSAGYAPRFAASRPAITTTLSDALGRRVSPSEVVRAIRSAMKTCGASPCEDAAPSRYEVSLAEELETGKYGSERWTRLR